MATYIAITTTNAQTNGWKALCYGANSDAVEAKARDMIGDPGAGGPGHVRDIYAETEQKNLMIVSKTQAARTYKIDVSLIGERNGDAVEEYSSMDEEMSAEWPY